MMSDDGLDNVPDGVGGSDEPNERNKVSRRQTQIAYKCSRTAG